MERNLHVGGEKRQLQPGRLRKKKYLPESDFTAMKMARTPHSSIGNLSAFLGPYTCTKQEHQFPKPLLHWKHFPPAVLALLVDP